MTRLQLYYDTFRCESDRPDPPELVALHGWGLHSLVWDEVMPELVKHFQVTVIDLPGLGRSPMPGGDYDLDYLTRHVAAVAPERAVWMGWSLGGMVAMNLAAQQPQRLQGLIGVATTPRFVQAEDWPFAMPQKIFDGFRTVLQEDWEGTLIRFLSLQCKDSATLKDDVKQLKELLFFHGLPARRALEGGLNVLQQVDLRDALCQLQCPCQFVLGENDNLIPVGVSDGLRALRPEAVIARIQGAAHVPFLSHPDLFVPAVLDFCREQGWIGHG